MSIFGTQKLAGKFNVTFGGIKKIPPIVAVSRTTLEAKNKEDGFVDVYALHITPFISIGFTIPRKCTE